MLSRIFLLKLFFIILLSACVSKNVSTTQNDQSFTPLPDESPVLTVTEALGKTQVDIPHDEGTQIIAEYDQDDNLIVFFTPSVSDFLIGSNESSLVNEIQKDFDDINLKSITIKTKSPSKFLISKQNDHLSRVVLVPVDLTPPVLPANIISSLSFKPANESLQIITYSSLPYEILPQTDNEFRLVFRNSKFSDSLLKKYDVAQLNTGFETVVAQNSADDASLIFSGKLNPALSILRKHDETYILLKNSTASPVTSSAKNRDANNDADAESSSLQELNTLFPGMKEKYTGEKISIDLQNADVEHVLRLISEISGHNLILDDEISGKISLKLVDIPWDQALDLVLLQKNLGMVIKGNIMRIASTTKLEAERAQLQKAREAAIQAQVSMQNLAPLKTEYIQINYNTAADFEGKVKPLITSRGSVASDQRTNILIVTDTEDTLKRINSFIKKLDRAERQVMIEARLVYATDEFQRSLGVKWGTEYKPVADDKLPNEQWRNSFKTTGLNMLNTVNGITLGGTIGKYLGEDLFALDASLQLGEAKNLVKTISSPRILTLNNNRAEIQQGTKLATATESESGGTTTEYEEAVLKISVLPQITPDNKLILDLDISDDSPKSDGRDIDTKQTKTKMMVNDRETIVIGGVQKTTETSGVNQIPGAGDIPGLGWLFKNKYNATNKAELLIFIQPRIL